MRAIGPNSFPEEDNELLHTPLFKQVSPEQANELIPYLHEAVFDKGDYIFREGDRDHRMYLLERGRVKLIRESKDRRVQLLSIHAHGELLGEIPVFDPSGGPRTATAVAMTHGTHVAWAGSMTRCSRGSTSTRVSPSTCCRCWRIACVATTSAYPTLCSWMCPPAWRRHCSTSARGSASRWKPG